MSWKVSRRGGNSVRPGKRPSNGCPFICILGRGNIERKGTEVQKNMVYLENIGWRPVGHKVAELNQDLLVQLHANRTVL